MPEIRITISINCSISLAKKFPREYNTFKHFQKEFRIPLQKSENSLYPQERTFTGRCVIWKSPFNQSTKVIVTTQTNKIPEKYDGETDLTLVGHLQLVKLLSDDVFGRQAAKVVVRERIQIGHTRTHAMQL